MRLGLRADQVRMVLPPPPLTPAPHGPDVLLGLAAIAGQATPVIDVARLLDPDAPAVRPDRLVLLTAPNAALAVDRLEGLEEVAQEAPVERLDPDDEGPIDIASLLDARFQAAWRRARAL